LRFSICVCTYNRAHILPYCLEALVNLKVPADYEAEILVVDNNSRDGTKDVVDQYSRRSRITILYFHEPHQGASMARNRATAEARGEYIGFLDDECVVRPDWLEIIAEDIDEFSPFIIGGPYIGALLPGRTPKWFKREYGDAYFLGNNFNRGYQKEFIASGGNMILHRSVCETRQFDQNLGPKANEMKFGEETFLQEHFLNENPGVMVFYEPRIEVAHYILPLKMSLSYHARRQMELGACHCRIRSAALPFELARAVAHFFAFPFRAAFRDRSTYPYWQNYAYEREIPRLMPGIGAAIERVRRRYR
jgi:glycosyltransferase involved in cell wall biosynthesis